LDWKNTYNEKIDYIEIYIYIYIYDCIEKLLGFKNWLDGKILVPKTCLDSNINWMEKLFIFLKKIRFKNWLDGKLFILKNYLDSKIY
jgi:hypothetical protein